MREGAKAMLTGSIAGLGIHYVITLSALNAQTGDVLAREEVEAESKESGAQVARPCCFQFAGQAG